MGGQDLDDLQAWGFNVVRLGVMWSAVETAPGVYNTTYLGIMRDLVQRMAARGIYTIVDAHQGACAVPVSLRLSLPAPL